METLAQIEAALQALADPKIADHSLRFFRTGPGEYGEGDRFRGIRVPALRKLAKRYRTLALRQTRKLLRSPYHEDRLLALLLLVESYRQGDEPHRASVFDLYLRNTRYVNNWDLVDTSAHPIVGAHLANARDRRLLDRLAKSENLWERRIAIIATYHFIKHRDEFKPTLRIAKTLVRDSEDLIHKAVGWMLREVGNRDRAAEEAFLAQHYRKMPRTMLRYAIEKFPPARRRAYLNGSV